MTTPPIAYIAPLEAGWARMKQLLFRPFDLSRWMVIGFTAWLATLGEGGGGSGLNVPDSSGGSREVGEFVRAYLPIILVVAAVALVAILAVALVLAWINARGKFMFLDNLLTGQARVAEPWRRWRRQGNSLFVWMVVFGFIVLGAILLQIGLGFALAWPDLHRKAFRGWALLGVLTGGLLLLPTVLLAVCIEVFLCDFVVVLMRRCDLKTNAAWRVFLRLFRARPGAFVLYLLLRFAFGLLVGTAVVIAGCLTCCCGFVLMAIPYIGTVVLLPVLAWERYWSMEFLRQFGPEYDPWIEAGPPLPAPQAERPAAG